METVTRNILGKSQIWLLVLPFLFYSCSKSDSNSDEIVVDEEPVKEISITNQVSFEGGNTDISSFKLLTIEEEQTLGNTEISSKSYACSSPQLMLVTNDNDEIVMMSRGVYADKSQNSIDAKSTAIALVTMHPLFAPVASKEYSELVNVITSSSYFPSLLDKVKASIEIRRNIYDESNLELISALSTLVESLCDTENDENFDPLTRSSVTRTTTIKGIDEGPFFVEARNKVLVVKNSGLTPMYTGVVKNAKGDVIKEDFDIPSRSDYGGLDLIVNRTNYGEEVKFDFTNLADGEYYFHFDRTTSKATLDFYVNITGNLLSVLGLPMSPKEGELLKDAAKFVWNAITTAGSSVTDSKISPLEWAGIAYGGVTDFFSSPSFTAFIQKESKWAIAKKVGGILGNSLNWYNKIKGSANMTMRIGWSLSSPKEVDFCLCYYNKEISSCSTAALSEVSGNWQEGYAGQRLLMPVVVKVRTTADDGTVLENSNYQKVKFSVVEGSGRVQDDFVGTNDKQEASTYWYLGDDNTNVGQKLKVVVVDIATGQEISEPIYFEASIKEASDITIRLDWDETSTRTDIDLHVIDPFGEEIYYAHPYSASGGWLDRDDVVGPGPEHVYWKNAPAGKYQILVRHYESESKGVIGYKITTYANGMTYRNVGSVAHHATDYVGTLTIPSSRNATFSYSEFMNEKIKAEQRVYPAKKKQDK